MCDNYTQEDIMGLGHAKHYVAKTHNNTIWDTQADVMGQVNIMG